MKTHYLGLTLLAFLPLATGSVLGAGYEFEGIGARQVSRAGAAVSDVDDWTSIYWNPAGLARSRTSKAPGGQVGLEGFGGVAMSHDGNSLSGLVGPVFSKNHLESSFLLGSLGVVRPAGRDWTMGAGVYTPLLQGADFSDANPAVGLDYHASAGIVVVNWSMAREWKGQFLAGAGVNAVYARLKTRARLDNFLLGTRTTSRMSGDGWGPEGVLGAQWKISPRWNAGAVYRTGSRISVKGDAEAASTGLPAESSRFTYKFNHPATAAVGTSFELTPKSVVSFDVNHTNWRSFRGDIDFEKSGLLLTDVANGYAWRNTFKFRLGELYRLSDKTDLLGGVSYDNYALDNGSIDFSTTVDVPIFRFFGGATRRLNDAWSLSGGVLAAKGRRRDENKKVSYTLGGWQAMLELAWNFSGSGS